MSDRLNVLLITTDQHNTDAVGCYGAPICRTPNIDRLAAGGTRFHTAYCTSPACTPARASILTGQYPHRHGMTSNSDPAGNIAASVHELQDHPSLMPRRMQASGYTCGYAGKWHIGVGEQQVFDHLQLPALIPSSLDFQGQDFPGHGSGGHHYPQFREYLQQRGLEWRRRRDPEPTARPCAVIEGSGESTVEHFITDHTIGLLDRYAAAEQPFVLWHNYWGPHCPCHPPEAWFDRYKDLEIPPWPAYEAAAGDDYTQRIASLSADWPAWERYLRYYYAFTEYIDFQIGRILDQLETSGLAERTLVLFCADHGEYQGHYRGLGDKIYGHHEPIQRIPFIARLPGGVAGQLREEFISQVDILPTMMDLAGQAADARLPGSSLLPLLRGEHPSWRESIGIETFGSHLPNTQLTLRRRQWKYGFNVGGGDVLYALDQDPHEIDNLAERPEQQGVLREMREAMLQWMEDSGFHAHAKRSFRQLRLEESWR